MTRYVGSRASGYPPDPVPFRLRPYDCGLRRLRSHRNHWAGFRAVFAFHPSTGGMSDNARGRPGYAHRTLRYSVMRNKYTDIKQSRRARPSQQPITCASRSQTCDEPTSCSIVPSNFCGIPNLFFCKSTDFAICKFPNFKNLRIENSKIEKSRFYDFDFVGRL
jgi:hypothetical protein